MLCAYYALVETNREIDTPEQASRHEKSLVLHSINNLLFQNDSNLIPGLFALRLSSKK